MRTSLQTASRLLGVLRWNRSGSRLLSNVAAVLGSRSVLEISGADSKALLQGLITNDISLLDEDKGHHPCISAAFLNPKGRVLGDALVAMSPRHEAKRKPGYLLDCPSSVAQVLKTHLKLYKLRSKVKIKDASTLYDVLVSGVRDPWQAGESGDGGDAYPQPDADTGGCAVRYADPRCAALGVRLIRPKGEADSNGMNWPHGDLVVPEERYHALRVANGVGEGSELVDSIPLESNLDLMGSISFTKGCYVGQELTARTQFKGFVRKRVLPVVFPANGEVTSASAIGDVPRVSADIEKSPELLLSKWGSVEPGGATGTPQAGSKVVDQAAGDGKLGALVAVSPEYNVGLALLRLGKIMAAASGGTDDGKTDSVNAGSPDRRQAGSARPAVDCRVVHEPGHGKGGEEGEERRRCLPLTPPWWPKDLDPSTGKVPS
ncbi:unnamed protein product [Scytosiphon promiscuus]